MRSEGKGMATHQLGPKRFPVYFLVDASASVGQREASRFLDTVEHLMGYLLNLNDERAAPIFTSLMIFQSRAVQVMPLISITDACQKLVSARRIRARGTSSLGAALELLDASIEHELVSLGGSDGDAMPLVFLLTDGQMTDDWKSRREVLSGTTTIICGDSEEHLGLNGIFRRQALDVARDFLGIDEKDKMHLYIDDGVQRLRDTAPRKIQWPIDY